MDFTVFTVFLGVITCACSLTLNIEPKQSHIYPNTTVTIMCQADGPIDICQFKWKNHWTEGPLVDLSLGPSSVTNTNNLEGDITGYNYIGTGLGDGQCGIRLLFGRWGSRTVGCRVRTEEDGWKYEDMTVSVDSLKSFPLIPSSREVVVKPGDNVNLMCSAQVPLSDCTFSLPGNEVTRFNQGHHSPGTASLKYFGTGLENGQCGATLTVTNEVNGNVICAAKTNVRREYEVASISITVASPPTNIELNLAVDYFTTGDVMNATCIVTGSRPLANITWYLGDEVIKQDSVDNSPLDTRWAWKNETRDVVQSLSRNLSRADNGKTLRCEARHLALRSPFIASKDLRVENPPACGTLRANTVDTFCFSDGAPTNCESPVKVGTIAFLACKTGFYLQPDPGYKSITCLPNGSWSNRIFDCLSDCGKRNTKGGTPLISYGDDAKIGEFPWHIAFYEPVDSELKLSCGGSLITKKIVISAAHCFWTETFLKLRNTTLFKAVAGKLFSEWDHLDDLHIQVRDIRKVSVPKRYRGRQSNFDSDIAVVQVSAPFDFSNYVNTVCVDWPNDRERIDLRVGNKGLVAGWGYTENNTQASILQVVELPYTSSENCFEAIPHDLWKVFTYDKYCAGYVGKNISACRGDSGGGMVYKNQNEKYYLRGIVSINFAPASYTGSCFSQLYTGFTKFSEFRLWVQSFV